MTPVQRHFVLMVTHLLCHHSCDLTHLLCHLDTPPVSRHGSDLRKRAALLISHLHPTTTAPLPVKGSTP